MTLFNLLFCAALTVITTCTIALTNDPIAGEDELGSPIAEIKSLKKLTLFNRDGKGVYLYNHYSYQNKNGQDIEEIYLNFIEKGYQILHHLHTVSEPYEHKLEILKNYQDYSPFWLQKGFTFGGMSLLTGPSFKQTNHQQAYLESIICVVWALAEKAFQRNDILDRGAFIIPDDEFRLLKFLENYCLFVSGCQTLEEFVIAKNPLFTSNLAYSRTHKNWLGLSLSSHFTQGRTHFQAGIDCRFGPSEQAMPYFPFSMSHILFGKVKTHNGNSISFFKPEPSGLADYRSLFSHGFEYFWDTQGSYLRREKDIPEPIAELALELAQTLLKTTLIKTIDHYLINTFKTLEEQKKLILQQFKESKRIDIASLWDLTVMIVNNSSTSEQSSLDVLNKALELQNKMVEIYQQSLEYRTGNEVLFKVKDLLLPDSFEGTDSEF